MAAQRRRPVGLPISPSDPVPALDAGRVSKAKGRQGWRNPNPELVLKARVAQPRPRVRWGGRLQGSRQPGAGSSQVNGCQQGDTLTSEEPGTFQSPCFPQGCCQECFFLFISSLARKAHPGERRGPCDSRCVRGTGRSPGDPPEVATLLSWRARTVGPWACALGTSTPRPLSLGPIHHPSGSFGP